MEPLVDVVIEEERWEALGLEGLALRAFEAVFDEVGLPHEGFTACHDAAIRALNGGFRGKDAPTNVLSWPSEERGAAVAGARPEAPEAGSADEPEALGDIAMAYETCEAEAKAAGKPMADHVTHLVMHGLLHLLGYDHIRDEDAALMEATEVRALARLGLSDPY
jgi:probable rRNA maturation factor